MGFNPFDKPLDELNASDLNLLLKRGVAEDYYVEFKSRFPSHEKIAHGIAAFANTYGGWFIVGVETDENNVASHIGGFEPNDMRDPIATIRDIIRSHIQPIPLFFSRIIELENKRSVFLLHVPENQDAPYITRDGRIYRRVSDAKDPVPETNRHALDELVARGRKFNETFEKFCVDDRPESESEPAWLSLYIACYPMGQIWLPEIYKSDFIEKRLERSRKLGQEESEGGREGEGHLLQFRVGQHTHESIILRTNEPLRSPIKSLSLELFVNGWTKIHLPIQEADPVVFLTQINERERNDVNPNVHAALTHFVNNADEDALQLVRIFNLSQVILEASALVNEYFSLIGKKNRDTEIRIAMALTGVMRMSAFVDSPNWAQFVNQCGLPIMQRSAAKLFHKGGYKLCNEDYRVRWKELAVWLTIAFGLPEKLSRDAMIRGWEHGTGESLGIAL